MRTLLKVDVIPRCAPLYREYVGTKTHYHVSLPRLVSACLASHFGNILSYPLPTALTDVEQRTLSRLKILLSKKEQGLVDSEEEEELAAVSGESDSDYDA
ncbi:hypothetical protein PRIPAC_96017 [Pristionchus pacificus]|uniref:Uncharacterized protein n=1 Tax=Pristionchus pacificus TaxID=54126 RepID=A0A2A6BDA3_PRIPA|nr:hypothetical protein PRIPAC_96017 [Pristionchus pacificus]|eukprot:PDM63865.1 hypothetical protein PRIPAC_49838 [Pristionchus pacificus]